MKKMKDISKKDIEKELSNVTHPEINFSLVKLGMIKDIDVKDNIILITLILPFLSVPIKEELIHLIKESIMKLNKDIKIKIKTAEMNEKERGKFMDLAKEGWML